MTSAPIAAPPSVPSPSWLVRAVGFFSGPVGFGIKLALLALLNALVLWAAGVLVADDKWIAALIAVAATALIDFVYLYPSRRLVPLKYLVPGVVFLVAFVVIPIVSNANIAFTNWSTGHNLTKDEAIVAIQEVSLVAPADGKSYTATPATSDGELVLLLVDEATGDLYVGTEDGLEPLPADSATVEIGTITAAEGYEVLQGNELAGIDTELAALVIPAADDRFIRAEGLSLAVELQPTLEYDSQNDTFTNVETGTVFTDNGEGSYESAAGEVIEPGWRTHIGFENFTTVLTNPLYRDPFVRVFLWTFVYAALSVFLSFALGLFLAIVLNKPTLKLRRIQRALLVLPFAIPAFLCVLVWRGLLERRVRGDQPDVRAGHPLALRCDVGEGLLHPRERLARVPVLLPRQHRRAAGDPRGAAGGCAGRRRELAPGLPARDAPPAARRHRPAADRVVRVQLQRVQQHLLPHRGRALRRRAEHRRVHGHPHLVHVQAGVLGRTGRPVRPRRSRLDLHLLHRRRHLRDLVLADEEPGDRSMTTVDQTRGRPGRPDRRGPPAEVALRLRLVALSRRPAGHRVRRVPDPVRDLLGLQRGGLARNAPV